MFKGDRNFAVGLFVTIAIAAFIFFVVWLTGRTGNEEMTRYTLLFDNDITGLFVGSSVKYMGMNIGTVSQMDLEQNDGIRIRVVIEILESTPVDHGTYASLALQGITGVAVVNLASDPGDHTPLTKPEGEEYPIIPVRVTGFSALMASAPEIMGKLDTLLTEATEILGEENQASIAGLLNNIEDITGSLAEERESIGAIPGNLNLAITEIQSTVVQLQDLLGQLQPGLNATIENANKSVENLASLTGRMDRLLQDHEADVDRFMEEGLASIPDLMNEAQQALRELEKLVRELQDDPSQMIYRQADNSVKMEP
jgi:phospholipid/cholesterol/gamma-HCH transport system substrate-binding protein